MTRTDHAQKCGIRYVCNFSCGAASAVATKLAIHKYSQTNEIVIVNAFVAEEHDDNRRFLRDCEAWFGQEIVQLADDKHNASALEVFRQTGFIKSRHGASCTQRLKRQLLDGYSQPGDVKVFGFTIEEVDRLMDFRERFPDQQVISPLIDDELTKEDCKSLIERAGIQLPMMYRLGYQNANCIGCVKGGEGYFRAIREDFPKQFNKLAQIEADIGPGAYLFRDRKTGKRWPLTELGDGPIRRDLSPPSCSFYCASAEQRLAEDLVS